MRNLLRCRRGSVAFATLVALVPLIGVVALGAEAGSWYVTKQHAQNAADAAAYSGGLACVNTQSCTTAIAQAAGQPFAQKNGFSNTAPQAVSIDKLSSWKGNNGTFVRAQVSQTQPVYLAAVLRGSSPVSIGATAVAQVMALEKPPCVLALSGSISFQGSPNINAPECGMASNSKAGNAINFTGGGMSMNLGSLSTAGGCSGHASFCNGALTHMPPVTNPFSVLDGVTMPTLPNCTGSGLTAYSAATPCKNNDPDLKNNNNNILSGGVYFISGTMELKGNTSYSGTALFILLPGASISLKGSSSMSVTANSSVLASQLPPAFQPYANLFANMAIYDRGADPIRFGGNTDVTFKGNAYLPNADVTFQGNPTVNSCGELIAKSIAFNGNATFNNTGCSEETKLKPQPYVRLVS